MNIWINFSSPKTRMIVLPNAEDHMIVCSFVWTKHKNVTDRQTNSLWLLQRSALRASSYKNTMIRNMTQQLSEGLAHETVVNFSTPHTTTWRFIKCSYRNITHTVILTHQ